MRMVSTATPPIVRSAVRTAVALAALVLVAGGCGSDETTSFVDRGGPTVDGGGETEDGAMVIEDGTPVSTPCGNGTLDPNEDCDGANLNGMTCQALGFSGGALACGGDCKLDKSACTGAPTAPVFGMRCGGDLGKCADGLICVIANEAGSDVGFCTAECSETVPCPQLPKGADCVFGLGDGRTVCGFLCAADNPLCPPGLTCVSDPAGNYYCSTDEPTVCGNGAIETGEECEGTNFGGKTCEALGYTGGSLTCNASCKIDASGCTGEPTGAAYGELCGNGIASCRPGLTCLLVNFAGEKKGYCSQPCGTGTACPSSPGAAQCIDIDDQGNNFCVFLCDSAACPSGLTCTTLSSGAKLCSTDPPPVCGNNTIEGNEECDGSDLNNMSCVGFGYASGTLKCDGSCKYDKTGCVGQSTCTLPPLLCSDGNAACSKLEEFPASGPGFMRGTPAALSWSRHDTAGIFKYASAAVSCLMPGSWPIHSYDHSMQDGSVPKTDASGLPCSPASSTCTERHYAGHVNGMDIDASYYTLTNGDNPHAPCPYTINGVFQNHCVGPPDDMDGPRVALWIGKAFESPRIRCLGVDGQIAPVVIAEAQKLASQGLITSTALAKIKGGVMVYETQQPTATNPGGGWYYAHWGHFHMSTVLTAYPTAATPPPVEPAPGVETPYAWAQLPSIVHPAQGLSSSVLDAIPLLQLHDPYDLGSMPGLRIETWTPKR